MSVLIGWQCGEYHPRGKQRREDLMTKRVTLTVNVSDRQHMRRIMDRIRKVDGVRHVQRVLN